MKHCHALSFPVFPHTAANRQAMLKHLRRDDGMPLSKRRRAEVNVVEEGTGHGKQPFRLALRAKANQSGCLFCPTNTCMCSWMSQTLTSCYAALPAKREVEHYHKREWCAKSVLPPFVSRLVKLADITSDETFYDLGCGNGSVIFQVAAMTGAHCVGVEINPQNAKVAQMAWATLQPLLEKRCGKKLRVDIICADFCELLQDAHYFDQRCVIWAANLLLPKSVNHYLSERLRRVAVGSRIFCFDDLYPHGRSIAAIRDPDAFQRFKMDDYVWQAGSVEWCTMEGPFYRYTRQASIGTQKEE